MSLKANDLHLPDLKKLQIPGVVAMIENGDDVRPSPGETLTR